MQNGAHSLMVSRDWLGFVRYLAVDGINRQYARTRLGPFWIVLAQFVTIFGIAIVFFTIFKRPFEDFLPYTSASLIGWTLLSQPIIGAPNTFVANSSLIQSFRLPFAIFPMQAVSNAVIVFLHGLAIHLVLMLVFDKSLLLLPLLIPALIVVAAVIYPVTAVLGLLGARLRDLAPMIASVMFMVFLLTPTIWDRGVIDASLLWVVDINPFYHLLEILRHPMLGTWPSTTSMLVSLGLAVTSLSIGEILFRRYSRPLIFWV
jgi:ABC-type polysaccharide/polyol phosphate export permease